MPPEAVVAGARALKGVPFGHQGRSVRRLDCMGLCVQAHHAAGLSVVDRTDYGRQPDLGRMKAALDEQLIRLPRKAPLSPGLVVLFADAEWVHTGIVTDTGIVHARGPEGVGPGVVEHRVDEQSWAPRLKGLWRHPGMAWVG